MSDEHPHLSAGQTYMLAIKDDPVSQAALRGVQLRLRVLGEALKLIGDPQEVQRRAAELVMAAVQPALHELESERNSSAELFARLLLASFESANAQLAKQGFARPGTSLEAWEHLARIVEKEPGPMTLGEIFDWAMAWADREKLRATLAASVKNRGTDDKPELTGESKAVAVLVEHPDWTEEQIAEQVGCNRSTLHRWEKFKLARAALKQGRLELPKGYKKGDSNEMDAWDEQD